jgi:hypothetical protein
VKKIAAWVIILFLMAIGAGCATPSSDLSYEKVVKENSGMGGVSDNNPNWKK